MLLFSSGPVVLRLVGLLDKALVLVLIRLATLTVMLA